jgi:hypothetical protein
MRLLRLALFLCAVLVLGGCKVVGRIPVYLGVAADVAEVVDEHVDTKKSEEAAEAARLLSDVARVVESKVE